MLVEGDRKRGRFIKQGSQAFAIVRISEFSFVDLLKREPIYKDNSDANIIHARFHSVEEISEGVEEAAFVTKELIEPNQRRPVLRPRDFTPDWKEQKRRRKNRDFADEEEEFFEAPEQEDAATAPQPEAAPAETAAEPAAAASEPVQGLAALQGPADAVPLEIIPNPVPTPSPVEAQVEAVPAAATPVQEPVVEPAAAAQPAQADTKLAAELEQLVGELQGLRRSILEKAQENFYEIAKALCESLLEKKLDLDPALLGTLIQKAIASSLENDHFTIRVHPRVAEALRASAFIHSAQLQDDDSLDPYAFHIDSEHGALKGALKDLVKNLLDQADLGLFERQE